MPIGTIFRNENGDIVADLKKDKESFIAAKGGFGGHGNRHFAGSLDTAPTIYEEGGHGESKKLTAELRVMAHVGLVRRSDSRK